MRNAERTTFEERKQFRAATAARLAELRLDPDDVAEGLAVLIAKDGRISESMRMEFVDRLFRLASDVAAEIDEFERNGEASR